jgi:metallo-beta-lactamase family protein
MKVQFIGGAGTVTGSKTLVESNGVRILIDCGQFQGLKPLRELNWQPLPVLPSTVNAVLLTHGHLDHCGWLPRLVSEGFDGKIYCTSPTKEVARLVMLDSAKIQEEEAELANRGHYSKHTIAEPLYTVKQAEAVMSKFRVIETNEPIMLDAEISAVFTNAGHIIGACSVTLAVENKLLVFSGDIGRDNDPLLFGPLRPAIADYVFLESTYGNRLHPAEDPKFELETYINNAIQNHGTVIIPGFAVERAQSVMFLLWQLRKENRIPDVPYILDTPMGISVLDIFRHNQKWHKLTPEDCTEMCAMFTMISDYRDTIDTIFENKPKVVIAASGMLTGGRVLSYIEHYIGVESTVVLLVGYQAEGTRGRKLLEGAREIKIRGKYLPVNAKILEVKGLSAHADQSELLDWLSLLKRKPSKIFLVHGENEPADELRVKIQERYSYDCSVAMMGQTVEI